jgi:transposase
MTPRKSTCSTLQNVNGGWYQRGRLFLMPKKLEISYHYLDLCHEKSPGRPSLRDLAVRAKISHMYARKVIIELTNTGSLTNPEVTNSERIRDAEKILYLDPVEELFLLALRAENPARSNTDYVAKLFTYYGTLVSASFISLWFKTRFDYKGSFRKPNLVPLDKFKQDNVVRYIEYKLKCKLLSDHSRYCFLDEKHLVNSDTVPKKQRRCPITGRTDFISVSGDFRKTYNMIACISANPLKQTHCVYTIGEENGTAESFMSFCQLMVQSRWLIHDEILIMDNAAVHTGAEAEDLEEWFWDYMVNGRPLHVLVIYLPTRSPELNPIELIFHIFSRRIRKYRTQNNEGAIDEAVVRYGSMVMDQMEYKTILNCYVHCGY